MQKLVKQEQEYPEKEKIEELRLIEPQQFG